MAQPTQTEVHVDRPLTSYSTRYMNDTMAFAADKVFPIVPVQYKSDSYYEFTAAYWFTDEMKPRAPGNPFPESGYGVSTATYSCDIFALAHAIPDEIRANTDDPMQPDREAAEWLAHKGLIRREVAFSTDFMVTSVWTTDNTSASDWDSSNGVPITNVQVARRTILNATGLRPNTLVMGQITYDGLVTNTQITDLIKYTQNPLPVQVGSILANALEIDNVYVSSAIYDSAAEGATSSMGPIMDDDALLVYSNPNPSPYSASAGMTFVWDGGGGQGVIERIRSDERKSDIARIQMAFDQKKVAASLGYFFSDIV